MVIDPDLISRGLAATDIELGIVNQPVFRVFIRGQNYERLAELTEWKNLEVVLRFNDVGTWILEAYADTKEVSLLTKKGGIIVTRELNGLEKTIFSGFVWTEWGYTANTFRAAGYSDEALLWTPARPTPGQAAPPFSNAYDVRTGVASTIMRNLVDLNIGPAAPTPWKINALTLAPDPLIGSNITSRANLQPLLTLLAELAITSYTGGLGFYLRQSDTVANAIEFGIYAPPDRSADAKFSIDLQTTQDYEDFAEAPEANHVYVLGGDDFGVNRTIIATQDNDSINEWGRIISTVIDRRGTTDVSELNQQAAEAIAGAVTLHRTAVKPFDVPSLQFGEDYDLGTLVTIVTKSGSVVDIIRQVSISITPDRGVTITPVVGTGDGSNDERVATIVRTIQNRLSNLERNWNVPNDSIIADMLHPTIKWYPGDLKATARSAAQPGWLLCDGSAVSRTTYSILFSAIGTSYGAGDGSTTFNLPNMIDRTVVGSGGTFAHGSSGGSSSIPNHVHLHSHGMNNHTHGGAPHIHPGAHDHGGGGLSYSHVHNVNFDHDHPNSYTQGPRAALFGDGIVDFNEGSGDLQQAADHQHIHTAIVEPPNPGTRDSGNRNNDSWSGTTAGTGIDQAASYSGNSGPPGTNSTEQDSNSSGATAYMPLYVTVKWQIFTGIIP